MIYNTGLSSKLRPDRSLWWSCWICRTGFLACPFCPQGTDSLERLSHNSPACRTGFLACPSCSQGSGQPGKGCPTSRLCRAGFLACPLWSQGSGQPGKAVPHPGYVGQAFWPVLSGHRAVDGLERLSHNSSACRTGFLACPSCSRGSGQPGKAVPQLSSMWDWLSSLSSLVTGQ